MSEIDWPIYFKDRLIVGNLRSNVGVVTLWMPKESVVSVLDPISYSVCGQLYTKRGINALLRNTLANARIRYIVMCGVDRQGSGDALKNFFNRGIKAKKEAGNLQGWQVLGDDEALLDKEIPREALETIREKVQLFDFRLKPLDEVADAVKGLRKKDSYGEPKIYPDPPPLIVERYPTDMSVFKIRRDFVGDAWIDALKTINRFGATTPGLYGRVKQVHNLCIVVEAENPSAPKIPDFLKFDKKGLNMYIKGFFDQNPGSEDYTYGERIYDWDGINQADHMVKKLTQFPYDRGALAVLWKPHIDNYPYKGKPMIEGQKQGRTVPCLVMVLGQCVDDQLHMTAIFRNNDIYGAWPLNSFALRRFQQNIAEKIKKSLGTLTTISHIAEIYEIDWDDSVKIVADNDSISRTCITEPRSYYVVEVEGQNIVVRFFTPDGSTQIAEFQGDGMKPKIARDLCDKIINNMLISDLGASSDLGRQIAKAEAAIKLKLIFEQDQPLRKMRKKGK